MTENLDFDVFFAFIRENIADRKHFQEFQRINTYFKSLENLTCLPIQYARIDVDTFKEKYYECKSWIKNKIYILTDVPLTDIQYNIIDIDDIKKIKDEDCTVVLAYNQDFMGIKAIEELRKYNMKYNSLHIPFPCANYYHTDEYAWNSIRELALTKDQNFKPYFNTSDFENIFQALAAKRDAEGDYVEIGTFKGNSAYAALTYIRNAKINKKSYFLDTYEGFNYDEAKNSEDALWKITDHMSSVEAVDKLLSEFENYKVVKNNIISDEFPKEIEKIAVCNIDVDMYEAAKAALYKVKDKVIKGGIILCEDYGHTPSLIGAQKAVKEFLAENQNMFVPIYQKSGQIMLVKY